MGVKQLILAIDQGTTSTRALLVDKAGSITAVSQMEHEQIFPAPGHVEHDALEIWRNTQAVLRDVLHQGMHDKNDSRFSTIAAVGITNQRETVIVWDPKTGQPIHHAIVWQDTRTQDVIESLIKQHGIDILRHKTGLPLSTYFSASKLSWLLDEIPGAREQAEQGKLMFGTPDSWLLWNLSGGIHGGVHKTDVTNASRTQLMDLETLQWDQELLDFFKIPEAVLPTIASSSEEFARVSSEFVDTSPLFVDDKKALRALSDVPITGILGDQQAATFGQSIFHPGMAKNTYGTGNFLLVNTGTTPLHSQNGLISTVAYQLEDNPAHYALEGSVAVTGSLVQWLRDNIGLIENSAEIEELASSVEDNGGVYFVPAFSGLFAPYWQPDARGIIAGLTRYATKGHIARSALEATAFQTYDLIRSLNQDLPEPLTELRVDGGMVKNSMLMQFQADILGIPVLRPEMIETTALGAAYAAGLAVGYWSGTKELEELWRKDAEWESVMDDNERSDRLRLWQKAIRRTLGWANTENE